MNEFSREHPNHYLKWYRNSNYIVLLTVKDKLSLYNFILKIKDMIDISVFREPDMNNDITAVVLAPGSVSKKICSKLKLLG